MSIFDDIESFSFSKNRNKLFGIKSGIVWGHSKQTNGAYPVLYISKPKAISQKDYEVLLENIQISFSLRAGG